MQGTAMGTKLVPKYANTFMHQLETQLMFLSYKKPFSILRHIDDLWTV